MLTLLFATYNGAHTLPRMLDALTRLKEPEGGWHVVVIDNGSTDATLDILAAFQQRLPMVVLREPRRGQNAARNTGLDARRGDLMVFTDDDVIPDPAWLQRLRAAADRHPEFDVFGGTILPLWEAQPPPWVIDVVPKGIAFALTPSDRGIGPMPLHWAFGPNYAVRSRYFDQGHRFRVDLGPREGPYPMGGETEFLSRIGKHGACGYFVKDAIVRHIIRPWQFEPRWLRRRACNFGRSQYHVDQRNTGEEVSSRLFGVSRWLIRRQAESVSRLALAIIRRDRRGIDALKWEIWERYGRMAEQRRHERSDRVTKSSSSTIAIGPAQVRHVDCSDEEVGPLNGGSG
jgi:hypothetical protein